MQQPLCQDCLAEGRTTLATDPHHLEKRSDGGALLTSKLLMLCHPHHSARTSRGE